MNFPLLSAIVFTPLIGAVVLLFLKREQHLAIKWIATLFAGITFTLACLLLLWFDRNTPVMQFKEVFDWIPAIGVKYFLGVDGISLPLVFLTALLTLVSLTYSFIIDERPKEFFLLFLLLEVGMLGVFLSLDFFLFYVFWEISLVPMYFIIGVWGGPNKEYAAIKFFLYTLVGSVAMLLSILALYFNTNPHTFDMLIIAAQQPFMKNLTVALAVFFGFFLAFAIKVPMFPFHTWLPDAHVEAPTAGSVILAGVLLKMGTYGFVRVCMPILPLACQKAAPWIAVLALISIIYGALVAMAQMDLKKLIAYSSVNHMGYVMLGTASAMALSTATLATKTTALNGAIMQMFNHGIITGALFMLVGVIYERTHNRDLNNFGGLGVRVPVFAGVFSLFAFGSLGLPGLSGFISEFLVFVGSFPIYTLFTALALLGVVISAAFFLWTIERMLLGPLNPKYTDTPDMDQREIWSLAPLVFLMVLIGLYPAPLLSIMNNSVMHLLLLR